mgnify:FL=1
MELLVDAAPFGITDCDLLLNFHKAECSNRKSIDLLLSSLKSEWKAETESSLHFHDIKCLWN